MKVQNIFDYSNKQLFNNVIRNKNVITPNVVNYKNIIQGNNAYIFEISKGRGIKNELFYGVTVVNYKYDHTQKEWIGENLLDKGKLCYSLKEANQYIRSFKN